MPRDRTSRHDATITVKNLGCRLARGSLLSMCRPLTVARIPFGYVSLRQHTSKGLASCHRHDSPSTPFALSPNAQRLCLWAFGDNYSRIQNTMWSFIWHTFFFDPVYNGLVFFIDTIPGGDVGLAIICITVVVKVILLPLSLKAARTQKVMREIEPELQKIKEKFKDKREEQAKAMMDLYRDAGLNPFSSIFLMFLQIPIIIALYFSVARGGGVTLPEINTDLLYAFVPTPETVDMIFFGFIDVAKKSLPLAALAGITQFIHARYTMPAPQPKKDPNKPDFKEDFARTMHLQMRYVLPVIIFVVAYTISAAVALYFTISNLANIAQELIVRRHR